MGAHHFLLMPRAKDQGRTIFDMVAYMRSKNAERRARWKAEGRCCHCGDLLNEARKALKRVTCEDCARSH